jgi:hypothetical protein
MKKKRRLHNKTDQLERFYRTIEVGMECWNWKGRTGSNNPYGITYFDRKWHRVHRLAWMLHNKTQIPKGLLVCHRCDNPICVRPDHLFLGTNADNTRDMDQKGRRVVSISKAVMASIESRRSKPECINGHPFDLENTRIGRYGHRECRACGRDKYHRLKRLSRIEQRLGLTDAKDGDQKRETPREAEAPRGAG